MAALGPIEFKAIPGRLVLIVQPHKVAQVYEYKLPVADDMVRQLALVVEYARATGEK